MNKGIGIAASATLQEPCLLSRSEHAGVQGPRCQALGGRWPRCGARCGAALMAQAAAHVPVPAPPASPAQNPRLPFPRRPSPAAQGDFTALIPGNC